jgi:phosphatidylglycerophosphate synthase
MRPLTAAARNPSILTNFRLITTGQYLSWGKAMVEDVGWAGPREPKFIRPPLIYLEAGACLLVFAVLMVLTVDTLGSALQLSSATASVALVVHIIISIIVLATLSAYPHRHFGLANVTTAFRAALTAAIGGMVLTAATPFAAPGIFWTIIAIAAVSLTLDGIDGFLARRNGTASRYGARFDMEVDALLILLLAMAAYLSQTAGAWVLLVGLMRYAFVAAQAGITRLRGELPESLRRKIICVVQGAALCLALVPVIPPIVQNLMLALALTSLAYSFAIDILHLLRSNTRARKMATSSSQ